MNRRNFIKLIGLAFTGLFVKPEPADPEWGLTPDNGEWIPDEGIGPIEGTWEYYVAPEEPFYLETGCGDPANWSTPKNDLPAVLNVNRHTYCVRWDLVDGIRYDVDGEPVTQAEFESHGVKFYPNEKPVTPEGTIVWWTYE